MTTGLDDISATSSFSIDGVSIVDVVEAVDDVEDDTTLFKLFFSFNSAVVFEVVLLIVDKKLFFVLMQGAVV